MALSIAPTTTCPVCELPNDYERQRADAMDGALFGTVRYAHCNECGRRIEEPWAVVIRFGGTPGRRND